MKKTNHLGNCSSPYLQQHANNPVDWYPWGEEALTKAKKEDKPILLSIGYSACHWCHVMAHESFEDEATAKIMNTHFINIKVDREERPDLDKIYQLAHQLILQRGGGWPLTMFLSPENQTPFFGGTYFPVEAKYNMPAFKDVLQKIVEFFHLHRDEINQQNSQLINAFQQIDTPPANHPLQLNHEPMMQARQHLEQSFDPHNGGFGTAPKFPHPFELEFLLHHWHRHPQDNDAISMVLFSLNKMALSGLFDQLGGGFFRYSVDAHWNIPHFEKMLYDNGPLLMLYCHAFVITKNPFFADIAKQTAKWLLENMRSEKQGFFATLDADSENTEGKYYYWDREQIRCVLNDDEYQVISAHYGFNHAPNFENHWHLLINTPLGKIADELQLSEEQTSKVLVLAKQKLLQTREKRVKPHRDEKILTSWNALTIKALAYAGMVLNEPQYISAAENALNFIKTNLWQHNQLLACFKDDKANLNAYLDDYAFLLDAIMMLLQARWSSENLEFGKQLANVLINEFQEPVQGSFYFTANNHETLLHRPKAFLDDATPSGNAIASHALNHLGHLIADTNYLNHAEKAIAAAWHSIIQIPEAHCTSLITLDGLINPPTLIIIRGPDEDIKKWQQYCWQSFKPTTMTYAIPNNDTNLPAILESYKAKDNGVCAYICHERKCSAPITDFKDFKETFNKL